MTDKNFGWGGIEEARRAWDLIGDRFEPFFIAGQVNATEGITFRGWEMARRILGQDLPCIRQETGDCVTQSATDLMNLTQLIEIAAGEAELFKPTFSPYVYATGRVLIGKNRLKGGAGSIGSWQAAAIKQYGVLPADTDGLPSYSGDLADKWGDDKGNWRRYLDTGDDHCIQTVAEIKSWTQLVDAMANGFLCTIASDLGFEMQARSDGFHRRRGSWAHQMGIWGVSDDRSKPWVAIHNQWGDGHGTIKDFETGETWPSGMLRVRPDDIEPAFRGGEVMAYSSFDGFPDRSDRWHEWALI